MERTRRKLILAAGATKMTNHVRSSLGLYSTHRFQPSQIVDIGIPDTWDSNRYDT
jgi:hypothetical protein